MFPKQNSFTAPYPKHYLIFMPGTIVWEPTPETINHAQLTKFADWLERRNKKHFSTYEQLWEWSVKNTAHFWRAVWDYFDVQYEGHYQHPLDNVVMPGANWFEGTHLNYAEHVFRNKSADRPALICKIEGERTTEMSWAELEAQVASFRSFLLNCGVTTGDRVAGVLTNTPEAIVAFLASCSIGAVWSSCSPDFGVSSVLDRFSQIEPKVLIGVAKYQYGGKQFGRLSELEALAEALPNLRAVVAVNAREEKLPKNFISWERAIEKSEANQLVFERVPFDHPIWVLYSSGTTGVPKAITHSQGGVLLEHLKYVTFHNDCHKGERFFWYTTTGWMMWNYLVGSMLAGSTAVLYEGSPAYPNLNALWEYAAEAKVNHFGTSAGYITACAKQKLSPAEQYNLSALRSIGSTGSPLPPEGFDWVYKSVKDDVWLTSMSGGTDVCSAFVGGCPWRPVYRGEIQCRALGCALEAWDDEGNALEEEVGEMVVTKPMPSMPIFFWNDDKNQRYHDSYFGHYKGIWRHGDWIEVTKNDGIIIYGRSDATLNRGGVRIGTAEVYRAVEQLPEVQDSLVIGLELPEGRFWMPMFVVLAKGHKLNDALKKKIASTLREEYTPRHVPDEVLEVAEVPYTISGKKMEAPVKKILMGKDISKSLNADAMRNPESLEFFRELYKKRG